MSLPEIEGMQLKGAKEKRTLDNVRVMIVPNRILSWSTFKKSGPYAIALDGVLNEPRRIEQGLWSTYINFDHHFGEDRYTTPSTSKQVYDSIMQQGQNGFFDLFPFRSTRPITVAINDCDPDVSLAVMLIRNAPFVKAINGDERQRLHELVRITNILDIHGGISPDDLPGSEAMEMQAWIFDPYAQFRVSGKINDQNPFAYGMVIHAIERRILSQIQGKGQRKELDTRHTIISRNGELALVHEEGYDARTALYHDGIKVIISVSPLRNGKYRYSVIKFDPKHPYPLEDFLSTMNKKEALEGNEDRWGGNNGVGGSPRKAGSAIGPESLERIARSFLV